MKNGLPVEERFDPRPLGSFRFLSHDFNEESASASFRYAFDSGPEFEETFVFHGANLPLSPLRRSALYNCLRYLHLVLGISYYKAAVPERIVIEGKGISEETARFMNKLYVNGLGEFAWRNGLDLRGRIRFPHTPGISDPPHLLILPERTAVPLGGGKDSVVTMNILQLSCESLVLFSLGDFKPIRDVASISVLPHITVSRKLSPALFELNRRGAYNGHVPISAIIAFTLPAAAVLYGFDTAVMSNERSANVGNLVTNGIEINHQYSKSLEFEKDVSDFFTEHVLADFRYFSFLRPLSDLGIARLFSRMKDYHPVFMSCNSAFRITGGKRQKWCLDCPKCRFTFLALAPFMNKDDLVSVFGGNLLDDKTQIPGFEELAGIKNHKPFECVGEIGETLAAFAMLAENPLWKDDLLVRHFAEKVLPNTDKPDEIVRNAMGISPDHLLPRVSLDKLTAYLNFFEEGILE